MAKAADLRQAMSASARSAPRPRAALQTDAPARVADDPDSAALDNPPAPGPKLKALLRRTPAWQK